MCNIRGYLYLFIFFFVSLFACSKNSSPEELFKQGDYKSSYNAYMQLAKEGNAEAQNYIGIHHYLGLGVPRNYEKAKEWFEKSAKNKFADAQYNLGGMYENGEFVKKDYQMAYMWLYAAYKNGSTSAAKRILGIAPDFQDPVGKIGRKLNENARYTKLFGDQIRLAEEEAQAYLQR